MPDLSSSIAFNTVLDKSGVSPLIRIIDTGTYPIGVPPTITGWFHISEPDGIGIDFGSFASPSIFFSGGNLIQPAFALRLANNNTFQIGGAGYSITYHLRATGYSDTTLTKTFTLAYTPPVVVMTNDFNLFTPVLGVTDVTNYTQAGMASSSVSQTWSALIQSVIGVNQTITGAGTNFDLAYLGSYYDSRYDVTLTTVFQYILNSPSNWVTIIDKLVRTQTYYAQIATPVTTLQANLVTLKNQSDASQSNCNTGPVLLQRYLQASAIYDDFRRRGCASDLSGLDTYIYQLNKLFNNNVTPTYINTNAVIPAYDFACGGGGSTTWASITGKPSTIVIEWTVGDIGFPGNGATVLTDARLLNIPDTRLIVVRGGLQQRSSNPGTGDSYFTKITGNNFLTFSVALSTSESIICVILPL